MGEMNQLERPLVSVDRPSPPKWAAVAALVLTVGLIGFLIGHSGIVPGSGWLQPPKDENPKRLIVEYMDALKKKDFDTLFRILGYSPDPKSLSQVKAFLSNEGLFTWKIGDYEVTHVVLDDGAADITVRETHYKWLSGPLIFFGRWIKTGPNTVSETFHLIRYHGHWIIDASHSGINLSACPVWNKPVPIGGYSDETIEAVSDWVSRIGFGQLFTVLGDPYMSSIAVTLPAFAMNMQMPPIVQNIKQAPVSPEAACQEHINQIVLEVQLFDIASHHFPRSLKELAPQYLSKIPVCPATGTDTYSGGYQVSKDGQSCLVTCMRHKYSTKLTQSGSFMPPSK